MYIKTICTLFLISVIIVVFSFPFSALANSSEGSLYSDTLVSGVNDTLHSETVSESEPVSGTNDNRTKSRMFFDRIIDGFKSNTDTNYVVRNDFALEVRTFVNGFYATSRYKQVPDTDKFRLRNLVSLTSDPITKVGFGLYYRHFGFNYSIDIIGLSKNKKIRNTDFSMSVSSEKFCVDFSLNKSKSHKFYIGDSDNGIDADDINTIRCLLDMYYVVNHKKFSYPAVLTRSYTQKLRSGSPLLGFSMNWFNQKSLSDSLPDKLMNVIDERFFPKLIKNFSFNINAGYAYNYVTKNKNVLIHLACMPYCSVFKNVSVSPVSPDSDPELGVGFGFVVRASVLWQVYKHYISFNVMDTYDAISRRSFYISDNYLRLSLTYGFRTLDRNRKKVKRRN